MTLPDRAHAKSWEGSDVVDRDGERLGTCVGVFADTATGVTEWLLIDVQGHRRSFVPALEATDADGGVRVPFSREQVTAAPQVGNDEELARGEEKELYSHYGVAYTDESESLLPQEAPVGSPGAPQGAAPSSRLRRVPQQTQSTAGSSGAGAAVGAPVAAVGGLVAAVWLGLRARERRARRQRSAAVRAQRARERAAKSSAKAAESASRQWALLAPVAAQTTRQLSEVSGAAAKRTTRSASRAASSASEAASSGTRTLAGGLAAASAAAAKAGHEASESVGALSAKAQETSRKKTAAAATSAAKARKKAATSTAKARKNAATSAAKTRKTAGKSAPNKAGLFSRRSRGAFEGVTSTAERSGRKVAHGGSAAASSVAAVPHAVERRGKKLAKRGRKARKSFARNVWELVLASAAAGGYVLGARAGRERYEEITDVASAVASRPEVQSATEVVRDPQKRQQALASLRERTASLTGRSSG
jgi:hypothetical protein